MILSLFRFVKVLKSVSCCRFLGYDDGKVVTKSVLEHLLGRYDEELVTKSLLQQVPKRSS